MIPSFRKAVEMPTMVTLAASLSQLHQPYVVTSMSKSPMLVESTDEETLDKARSHLLEGMQLLNEVYARTKARTSHLAA